MKDKQSTNNNTNRKKSSVKFNSIQKNFNNNK